MQEVSVNERIPRQAWMSVEERILRQASETRQLIFCSPATSGSGEVLERSGVVPKLVKLSPSWSTALHDRTAIQAVVRTVEAEKMEGNALGSSRFSPDHLPTESVIAL